MKRKMDNHHYCDVMHHFDRLCLQQEGGHSYLYRRYYRGTAISGELECDFPVSI